MTAPRTETVLLPEALYRRLNITAAQVNVTPEAFVLGALTAYIDDPESINLPMLPAPGDRICSTSITLDESLHARLLRLHRATATRDGMNFDAIVTRVLYLVFDTVDTETSTLNLSVELAEESYDALAAQAARAGVDIETAFRRAFADLMFNPPLIRVPAPLPEGTPLYSGAIRFGRIVSDRMQDVINRSVNSNAPLDSTKLIRLSVENYLAALAATPAPAPRAADPTIVSPASRRRSGALRL